MMPNTNNNLRKAAIFLRSLDADTAAAMLGQLTPDEAAALRAAMREVGQFDLAERDDVAAEFRRARPAVEENALGGVELQLSSPAPPPSDEAGAKAATSTTHIAPADTGMKPFEFLQHAPIARLVPYLAREHAQTIAVVLSRLDPARAASVLAGLPDKLQSESLERLASLGETDPESVVVVERELAAWMAGRTAGRRGDSRRNESALSILAAADVSTRRRLLDRLRTHNALLANELAPNASTNDFVRSQPSMQLPAEGNRRATQYSYQAAACARRLEASFAPTSSLTPVAPTLPRPTATLASLRPQPLPTMPFDDLLNVDKRTLAAIVRELDTSVLVLALAGSKDELTHYICSQLPRRVARGLRRELRHLGPTLLSDVEAAQKAVSRVASKHVLQSRRHSFAASA